MITKLLVDHPECRDSDNKQSNLAPIPVVSRGESECRVLFFKKENTACGKPECVATSQERQADKIFFMNYSEREN